MKKWLKVLGIVLIILVLLVLISLVFDGGRFFWKQTLVVPLLKPFSEPCGYGGTSGYRVDCDCGGTLISEIATGSTAYFCTGSCGQCQCYEQDWSTFSETGKVGLTEVDCSTLSQLSWAFPLNK